MSAGYNEVPDSVKPCIDDPQYRWCARDVIQETFGRALKFCPTCGTRVQLEEKCSKCEQVAREYAKRCSSCHNDLAIKYECPTCKTHVFREFLPGSDAKRSGKLLDMCRALHAEENAILSLSRAGVRLPDHAVLYCTTFPCNLCANKIAAVGIKTVVYAEPYPMEEARKILESHRVTLKRFEGVKSNAYFRMYA